MTKKHETQEKITLKAGNIRILKCGNRTCCLQTQDGSEMPCTQCAEIAIDDKVYALFQEDDAPYNQDRDKVIVGLEIVIENGEEQVKQIQQESVVNTLVYVYEKLKEQLPEGQIVVDGGATYEEVLSGERELQAEFIAWVDGKRHHMFLLDTVEAGNCFYAIYAATDKEEVDNKESRGVMGYRLVERGGKSIVQDIEDDAEYKAMLQAFFEKQRYTEEEKEDILQLKEGVLVIEQDRFCRLQGADGGVLHFRRLGFFRYAGHLYAFLQRVSEDAENDGLPTFMRVIGRAKDGQYQYAMPADFAEVEAAYAELKRLRGLN